MTLIVRKESTATNAGASIECFDRFSFWHDMCAEGACALDFGNFLHLASEEEDEEIDCLLSSSSV